MKSLQTALPLGSILASVTAAFLTGPLASGQAEARAVGIDRLIQRLGEEATRRQAADALVRMGYRAVAALEATFASEKKAPRAVQLAVLEILARMNGQAVEATPALLKAMYDLPPDRTLAVMHALAEVAPYQKVRRGSARAPDATPTRPSSRLPVGSTALGSSITNGRSCSWLEGGERPCPP